MSFTSAITDARIRKQPDGRCWVMHPANDAILAYCDSLVEADRFVVGLKDLAKAVANGWAFTTVLPKEGAK